MFMEASFIKFDALTSIVSVSFLKKFILFSDVLEKEKKKWSLILQHAFGHQVQLHYNFELAVQGKNEIATNYGNHVKNIENTSVELQPKEIEKVDVSCQTTWKLAHELMKHFDGVITEISRDMYE